jgi:hypothetical protein
MTAGDSALPPLRWSDVVIPSIPSIAGVVFLLSSVLFFRIQGQLVPLVIDLMAVAHIFGFFVCSFFSILILLGVVPLFPNSRSHRRIIRTRESRYSLVRECARLFVTEKKWNFQEPWNPRMAYAGLFIMTSGSFGNQVIAFVNARFFALTIHVQRIICFSGWMSFATGERFVTSDGVEISIAMDRFHTQYPEASLLASNFFWAPEVCDDWSWKEVLDGAAHILRRPFPPLVLGEHELVLVLRGGVEMWTPGRLCKGYMQAPCQYFLDIMKNFSKTIVVGGDSYPCKDLVVKAGAREVSWNEFEATRYMLYARNVAFSRTSRAHATIALSPFWRRFWLFDTESEKQAQKWWWRGFKPWEYGDVQDCVASEEYRMIGNPWIPNATQKQLVMNGTCEFKVLRGE